MGENLDLEILNDKALILNTYKGLEYKIEDEDEVAS